MKAPTLPTFVNDPVALATYDLAMLLVKRRILIEKISLFKERKDGLL